MSGRTLSSPAMSPPASPPRAAATAHPPITTHSTLMPTSAELSRLDVIARNARPTLVVR